MTLGVSFRVWVGWVPDPSPICPSSQFVGLLFAPTVTLPCTCSSDRGWCGMGPPGRKYKPLSLRCLADNSCGGPAAPRFRHVPPTPQWGDVLFEYSVMSSDGYWGSPAWAASRFDAADKGVTVWSVGWLNGSVPPTQESFATAWATDSLVESRAWGWTEFGWHACPSRLFLLHNRSRFSESALVITKTVKELERSLQTPTKKLPVTNQTAYYQLITEDLCCSL